MNPSLTRGEYWLLESAVEAGLPLCWLVSENLDQILNKQAHGLSRELLLETMAGLFNKGWIEFESGCGDKSVRIIHPDIEKAICESRGPNNTFYSLTALGGTIWENFARPDWNRFIDHTITCENKDDETAEFICANDKLLKLYFNGIYYVGITPRLNTVQYDIIEPWSATYWKELQRGFRVRFQYNTTEDLAWGDVPASYMFIYDKRWYRWN